MSDSAVRDLADRLKREFRMYVLRPASWAGDELRHAGEAVEDLATLMGGPARFRAVLRWVLLWRAPFRTPMAAMAMPLIDVVYFKSASWGDPPELKWQTVHELAHVWDIRTFYRHSRGLKNASGASYGRFKWQSPIPFEYHPGDGWLEGRKPPLNALEDWAESVATCVYADHAESARGGPRLISPARWNYVREHLAVRLAYPAHWIPHFSGPG
ncbi:MAG TPA: hypothetical protein VM537_11500 [Anaerolineae bacterium]|nr:hypothetical protein [Anaerolineae bacterium]